MTESLFPELPATEQRQRAHLTFKANIRKGRYGWLRLTPAYSLHLVREILEECKPEDLVLDPFSGTGTTPLVAACMGIRADAVDINPFLVWLGNLKLTRFEAEVAEEFFGSCRSVATRMRRRKQSSRQWVPALHQIEKWWDRAILDVLSELFDEIRREFTDNGHAADLARVAFCRVMIETSHAAFNHQSMSFKKSHLKSEVQAPLLPEEVADARWVVLDHFVQAAEVVSAGLGADQPIAPARVFLGDSRELERVLPGNQYTKVVTSPPYPNRMSYIREVRPYMYWLGFLSDGRQAGELDWRSIGGTWGCATSNLGSWRPDPSEEVGFPGFTKIVGEIASSHELLGRYVHKYFEDIKRHFRSLLQVMVPGGTCFYVVGNSKFYQTMVPVEEIYAALLEDSGFTDGKITRIRKRNSKKELYEFVVSANAPER